MGRHTILTKELTNNICNWLEAGNYIEHTCDYVGISISTYYSWFNKGEAANAKAESGEELDESEKTLLNFYLEVKKARAAAFVRNVALIQKAAQQTKTWQAAAWWLERSDPKRFGRVTQIAGPNNGPVKLEVSVEEVEQLLGEIIQAEEAETTSHDDQPN